MEIILNLSLPNLITWANKSLEFYPTRAKEIKQKRKEMRQNIGQRDSKSFVAGFEDEGRGHTPRNTAGARIWKEQGNECSSRASRRNTALLLPWTEPYFRQQISSTIRFVWWWATKFAVICSSSNRNVHHTMANVFGRPLCPAASLWGVAGGVPGGGSRAAEGTPESQQTVGRPLCPPIVAVITLS